MEKIRLVSPSVEQPSPKGVKTGKADIRPHTPPVRIFSSLPDKYIALLDKLNGGKTHLVVAARLAYEATCKRLRF